MRMLALATGKSHCQPRVRRNGGNDLAAGWLERTRMCVPYSFSCRIASNSMMSSISSPTQPLAAA